MFCVFIFLFILLLPSVSHSQASYCLDPATCFFVTTYSYNPLNVAPNGGYVVDITNVPQNCDPVEYSSSYYDNTLDIIYTTDIKRYYYNGSTWVMFDSVLGLKTSVDYGPEQIPVDGSFDGSTCETCDEQALYDEAVAACFGQDYIASVDLELCTYECAKTSCVQLRNDFNQTLSPSEIGRCVCGEDETGVLSNVCEKKDCQADSESCEQTCAAQGLAVASYTCDFDTQTCECEQDTCGLRYSNCLKHCGTIRNFACDPATLITTCDCAGDGTTGDNYDSPPPSDVPDNTQDNSQSSDPSDTVEQSNNKLVDNTQNIIENQNSLAEQQKAIGDKQIDHLANIERNTSQSSLSLNKLEQASHVTSTLPLQLMEQQMQSQVDEQESDHEKSLIEAQVKGGEVESWYSSWSSHIFAPLTCTDECHDIYIDVPTRSESLVIHKEVFANVREILRWMVYLATTVCLMGILLSIGPDGSDTKQKASICGG